MPIPRLSDLQGQVHNRQSELRHGAQLSRADLEVLAAQMLTSRAMDTARLYETSTTAAVNAAWNKNFQFFFQSIRSIALNMATEELRDLLTVNDGGRALENVFKNNVKGMTTIPEETPPAMCPTARERITALKARMAAGEFRSTAQKRTCLAEILAARRDVGVNENGYLTYGEALSNRVSPDVSQKARGIESELAKMPEETVERLYTMAGEGFMGMRFAAAMHAEFERLRRSPAQREMAALQELVKQNSIAQDKDVAAELLWLREHWNDTQEELDAAREDGSRTQEVAQIRQSPEFESFLEDRSGTQLANMMLNADPMGQDPLGELRRAYDRAAQKYESFFAPYEPMYQKLTNDPVGTAALLETMSQLVLGSPEFRSDMTGGATSITGYMFNAMDETVGALADLEDKAGVIQALDKLRTNLTWFRGRNPNGFAATCKKFPNIVSIVEAMDLPEPGSAGEFNLILQGLLLANGNEGAESYRDILFGKLALHEQAGNGENWQSKPIDEEALNRRVEELQTESTDLGDVFEGYSNEEVYTMLRGGGNGAELKQYYEDWKIRTAQQRQREEEYRANLTAESRLQEILKLPLRQRLFTQRAVERDDAQDAVQEVMGVRAMARELQAHPERFQTVEAVEERYNYHVNSYKFFDEPIDKAISVITTTPNDLDGAGLEKFFRENMGGVENYSAFKRLEPEALPTARAQIEGLQATAKRRLDRGVVVADTMRSNLAQIIAARQVLNVRANVWGGDIRMDQRLPDGFVDRADAVREELNALNQAQLRELYQKSLRGHGGELEKAYEKAMAQQAVQKDELPRDLPQTRWPTAKERIEVLQEKLRTTDNQARKLKLTAEIIAARETVEARRGGAHLDRKLDPAKYAQRVADVEDYLLNMTGESTRELAQQALAGHGGDMLETYRRQNTYACQIEAIKEDFSTHQQHMDVARAMALYIHGEQAPTKPVNEARVANTAEQIRMSEGYETFSQSPATYRLLVDGNLATLADSLNSHKQAALNRQLDQEIEQIGLPDVPGEPGQKQENPEPPLVGFLP